MKPVIILVAIFALLIPLFVFAEALRLPAYDAMEESTDLYIHPARVTIDGYGGEAMEPFISPDGKFLFFNNENSAENTDIHFAKRSGKLSFKYLGPLTGVNSPKLDAVPTMDSRGGFYFTTMRQYEESLQSVFAGQFDGKAVQDAQPVAGAIHPQKAGDVNMDTGISPDGKILFISRARFRFGIPVPQASDLLVAARDGASFAPHPKGADMLQNVNTPALEYAPAISANGRELYFTRASRPRGDDSGLRIMVAARASADGIFGPAKIISAAEGFVEAPTITLDAKEMFFHKKVDGKFMIFRAERNPKAAD
jgi:hypothetical protein